jgi:integrase
VSTKTADWTYQLTKKLEKGFGHLAMLPPQEITPGHVEVALQDLERAGNGPRSINEYRKIMHAVMQFALDREAIRRNPVNVIAKRPEPAEQVDPIPTADLKKLILGAEPQLSALLTVLSQTGARFREIALLPWSEVFTGKAEPFVILTTRKQRGGREKKTPQPLTPTAVRAIEAQRGRHDRWVFPSPRGSSPLVYNTAQKALQDLCVRLELPRYRFHQVRHWTGLVAGMAGKNTKAVAKWLRHDSTQSTERYRHAIDREMWEIAAALENEIGDVTRENKNTPAEA